VATPVSTNGTWRFGVYEVDTRRVELRRSGTPVKLREQSFLVLVYLLEHAGDIVTREELRQLLWPSDTFVDFDHSLSTAVMKLREALGDSTDAPIYIETIPKRGYRFIAPVSQVADSRNELANSNGPSASGPVNGTSSAQQAAPAPAETSVPHRRLGLISAVIGLLLVGVGSFLVFLRIGHFSIPSHDAGPVSSAFKIVPVTSAPGSATSPAISPDGREVAYLWDGPERRRDDVYVQFIGSDTPLRLTYSKSGFLGAPASSPHGREIAFTRCDGKNNGVYTVPALGGAERKLTNVACLDTEPGPLAWLPDGTEMLMVDLCPATGRFDVVRFSLATGEKQCLTPSGPANRSGDVFKFSLSPEGRTIAFTASAFARCLADIYTIPLSGGAPHQLTAEGRCFDDLMWTPDGSSIVFTSNRTTLVTLWRVSAYDGQMQRETVYPAIGSFSADGRRLVYSEHTSAEAPAIWRADLFTAGGHVLDNRNLIHTPYPEMNAQPSPDGAWIAWRSNRSGFYEIWRSEATGGNPLQLTHLENYSDRPAWSPDGRWIAFQSVARDSAQIFIVDAEGRNLHSISDRFYGYVTPSWSRDGRSVYLASTRTGSLQVWKHALEGGAELQLTKGGGFFPFESYDGLTIYFSKPGEAGVWSVPASGGTESQVVAGKPQYGYMQYWAIAGTGLYLLNAEAEPRPRIEFYDFATHRISPVLALEKKPAPASNLSATADGRTLYYGQSDPQSAIMMMEVLR
jgi:Tol biopolymer transport system component/DNA-binding winged helix-turn-helix (wHTH) protein